MRTTFTSGLLAAVVSAQTGEPNPPTWDSDRVLVFDPSDTDCQSRVQQDVKSLPEEVVTTRLQ